jgi:hypothetical protein
MSLRKAAGVYGRYEIAKILAPSAQHRAKMPAFVQRPAPSFAATSVQEGQFKDVSLEELKGKWWVSCSRSLECSTPPYTERITFQGGSFLLPIVRPLPSCGYASIFRDVYSL